MHLLNSSSGSRLHASETVGGGESWGAGLEAAAFTLADGVGLRASLLTHVMWIMQTGARASESPKGRVVVLVALLCPTLCKPTDCSLPGFSVCAISQARILEWVAISFSRGASRTRDGTRVPFIGIWILNHWTIREVPASFSKLKKKKKKRVNFGITIAKIRPAKRSPHLGFQLGRASMW